MALMTQLRERMQIVLWALLILFVLSMSIGGLVGGANIIDQLLGRVNPSEAIGSINGDKITPDQFNQAVNMRLEALRNNGTDINDQFLDGIRKDVWNAFVDERLTEQAIKDLKIKVSDEDLLFYLQNDPPQEIKQLFSPNGQFDKTTYDNALNTPGSMDWTPIENWMRNFYIPRLKLQQRLNSSVAVTENDVREEFIKRNLDYTISAIHITKQSIKKDLQDPSDEQLLNDYKKRKDEFLQDEKRHLSFVSWPKNPSTQDTLNAKQEALDVLMSYGQGEDFSKLANIHSQDPGNQVTPDSGKGGDLGWFGKGQMLKPFEDAVFSARSGAVVGPVLTQYGYHVIKVDSIKNRNRSNHQVKARHILINIELGQNTRTELRRKATLFSYDSYDYGFLAALDSAGAVKQTAIDIRENDFFVYNLGSFRQAVRWAFDAKIGDVSDPMETNEFYAVFKLDSINEAGIADFEDVKTQIFASISNNNEEELAQSVAKTVKEKILSGNSFESIKKENNLYELIPSDKKKLKDSFISFGISEQLTTNLLTSKIGDVLGPIKTFRGYGVVKVENISAFDSSSWSSQRNLIEADLIRQKEASTYQEWMNNLRETAKIVDNRKYFF